MVDGKIELALSIDQVDPVGRDATADGLAIGVEVELRGVRVRRARRGRDRGIDGRRCRTADRDH